MNLSVPKSGNRLAEEKALVSLPSMAAAVEELDSIGVPARARSYDYTVAHHLPGRLRLIVEQLKSDPETTSCAFVSLGTVNGVLSVRTNYWAASVVVNYDASLISEAELLELIDALQPGGATEFEPPRLTLIARLLNGALRLLDKTLPAFVQLGLGVGAFASAALGLPATVTRVLLTASVLPIATRALHTAVEEKKFGVDALDGSAAALMLANGRFVEASFMTMLIAIGEFIREQTARRCEQIVNDLLGLSGRSAWLVKGRKRICVPANEVKVGDTVVVYP
ncbi:MAG: HMA2 domain-containing protein, partial [Terriglobales bacterium]